MSTDVSRLRRPNHPISDQPSEKQQHAVPRTNPSDRVVDRAAAGGLQRGHQSLGETRLFVGPEETPD